MWHAMKRKDKASLVALILVGTVALFLGFVPDLVKDGRLDPPEQIEVGFLQLSSRPGLGVRINQKTAARYRAG